MAFKINISEKNGKTWKVETTNEELVGKALGDKLSGKDLSADLEGYELQITGASDIAGFPHKKDLDGAELRKVLFTRGWGMHDAGKGMRLKKSVRGKQIGEKTIQINTIILKAGHKHLKEIFPEQNKPVEEKTKEDKPKE